MLIPFVKQGLRVLSVAITIISLAGIPENVRTWLSVFAAFGSVHDYLRTGIVAVSAVVFLLTIDRIRMPVFGWIERNLRTDRYLVVNKRIVRSRKRRKDQSFEVGDWIRPTKNELESDRDKLKKPRDMAQEYSEQRRELEGCRGSLLRAREISERLSEELKDLRLRTHLEAFDTEKARRKNSHLKIWCTDAKDWQWCERLAAEFQEAGWKAGVFMGTSQHPGLVPPPAADVWIEATDKKRSAELRKFLSNRFPSVAFDEHTSFELSRNEYGIFVYRTTREEGAGAPLEGGQP